MRYHKMKRYMCVICGFIYDEEKGVILRLILAGPNPPESSSCMSRNSILRFATASRFGSPKGAKMEAQTGKIVFREK